MNKPEQDQINHWLNVSKKGISKKWYLYHSGFYEQESIPVQGMYGTLALMHSSLGRAKFLNDDSKVEIRDEFIKAAQSIKKSFTMAYDKNDPDFVGDDVDWSCVMEAQAVEGINYALMGGDFETAHELATIFQDPGDGDLMPPVVNRYAHALAETIKGDHEKARVIMDEQFDHYAKSHPTDGYEMNYYTLSTALKGILDNDETTFNKGLLSQLEFYQSRAKGEYKNTTQEFICDPAVALANLGIKHGLNVTVEYSTLPQGLLITE